MKYPVQYRGITRRYVYPKGNPEKFLWSATVTPRATGAAPC
ncbi:hypothetical protein BURMUCGD2M_5273 [Burkholderia multivorans CGD2M]|uniref:Uncharacterized protein n=1 Tax=Burkholderia multivorans CGD2 TaxID=513052 RepID=B9BJM4_9BURK|nr:hypothetical protein BURMUCGD1_4833 [Burkholderia multivorans CGD1]EEE09907.1 hypothetical protein BURMUCGD2_5281 [Burkholderia multivorans CGD2]EEE15829.1 hypothetical protein BURMUCGD2M_5273 [Burkholderia multivorans CGD2M]